MRKARSSGFTVIEVMIVLAVTGLLFLSASALISGKTDQTEFDQSSRAFQQQIQGVINEVATGTYTGTAGSSNYSCSVAGKLVFGPGGNGQGTNSPCEFIGKLIEFGLGANQDGVDIYTLAGARQDSTGKEVSSLANAYPAIVQLGTGQDDVTSTQLEYGLHTYAAGGNSSMNYSTNGGATLNPIGAFALVYSLAAYNGGNITSGTQQVNVVPLGNSQLGESQTTLENHVLTNLPNPVQSPDNPSGTEITICTKSSTTNQYALLVIGGSNDGQLGVTLSILDKSNGTTCP